MPGLDLEALGDFTVKVVYGTGGVGDVTDRIRDLSQRIHESTQEGGLPRTWSAEDRTDAFSIHQVSESIHGLGHRLGGEKMTRVQVLGKGDRFETKGRFEPGCGACTVLIIRHDFPPCAVQVL